MMPKSTATMSPAASTNRLPWCMSAWKKPSRSAWRRKACIRFSRERRQVVAGGAERLEIGELDAVDPFEGEHVARRSAPSRPPARGSPGRRRSLSAISESAAASSRRSISSVTERASVSTTATGRSRRDAGSTRSIAAGAGIEGVEVAAEALPDAGPEHLDRDRLAARPRSRSRPCGPARSRRRRPAARTPRRARRPACRAPSRSSPAPPPRGKARSRRGAGRASSATSPPTMSGRVARNWPSLT